MYQIKFIHQMIKTIFTFNEQKYFLINQYIKVFLMKIGKYINEKF